MPRIIDELHDGLKQTTLATRFTTGECADYLIKKTHADSPLEH
jgi:hypothetical protein